MTTRLVCVLTAGLLATTVAFGTGTATLYLESPVNGQVISAGSAVAWTIKIGVSSGDNLGLALISADWVQDATNPATLDIPPGNAGSIPAAMNGFNRPGGITNPGEGGALSGYIGVQRGDAGALNLIQCGGGQNTFGLAGSGFGTDPNVDAGIGQSGQQVVLSGTFPAPGAPGAYTYRLANVRANVLTTVGTPPNFSQVAQAAVNLDAAVFTFTINVTVCLGDANCDGVIDFDDINSLVAALSGGTPCSFDNCDANSDGAIDFDDINAFVAILSAGNPCP